MNDQETNGARFQSEFGKAFQPHKKAIDAAFSKAIERIVNRPDMQESFRCFSASLAGAERFNLPLIRGEWKVTGPNPEKRGSIMIEFVEDGDE